jgi:hypothetical protein
MTNMTNMTNTIAILAVEVADMTNMTNMTNTIAILAVEVDDHCSPCMTTRGAILVALARSPTVPPIKLLSKFRLSSRIAVHHGNANRAVVVPASSMVLSFLMTVSSIMLTANQFASASVETLNASVPVLQLLSHVILGIMW